MSSATILYPVARYLPLEPVQQDPNTSWTIPLPIPLHITVKRQAVKSSFYSTILPIPIAIKIPEGLASTAKFRASYVTPAAITEISSNAAAGVYGDLVSPAAKIYINSSSTLVATSSVEVFPETEIFVDTTDVTSGRAELELSPVATSSQGSVLNRVSADFTTSPVYGLSQGRVSQTKFISSDLVVPAETSSQGRISIEGISELNSSLAVHDTEGLILDLDTARVYHNLVTGSVSFSATSISVISAYSFLNLSSSSVEALASTSISGSSHVQTGAARFFTQSQYDFPWYRLYKRYLDDYQREKQYKDWELAKYRRMFLNAAKENQHSFARPIYLPGLNINFPQYYLEYALTKNYGIDWSDIIGDHEIVKSWWVTDLNVEKSAINYNSTVVWVYGDYNKVDGIYGLTNHVIDERGLYFDVTFFIYIY